jgi:hypothetical protein
LASREWLEARLAANPAASPIVTLKAVIWATTFRKMRSAWNRIRLGSVWDV